MKIDVVVEIPKGSNIKYEVVKDKIYVDRILYGAYRYPLNYGFVENTLDWDGDPIDVLIISNSSFHPGSIVPTRILGLMHMIDSGETDTKLIGVIDVDPRFNNYEKLEDIDLNIINEVKDFFENYKNLQNKKVIIDGFGDVAEAESEINVTKKLYEKYGEMEKDKFISLMKKKFPSKYTDD